MAEEEDKTPDLLLPNVPPIGENIYKNPVKNDVLFSHLVYDPETYNKQQKDIEDSFLDSEVADPSYIEDKQVEDYFESDYRSSLYKTISTKDKLFNDFLKGYFGSSENFIKFTTALAENKTYDPSVDQLAEIVITTKEKYFKASYISQTELLFELLSGICTVEFVRIDGRADRLICTLSEELVPQSQSDVRYDAFSGLAGRRILVWNLIKGDWSSFYLETLIRFVRDDSSEIE